MHKFKRREREMETHAIRSREFAFECLRPWASLKLRIVAPPLFPELAYEKGALMYSIYKTDLRSYITLRKE